MRTFTPALLALLPTLASTETVLGVYIFHRHGDRTAKSTPPTSLTDLGYQQVFTAGYYFRSRYLNSSAPLHIAGISADTVKLSQVSFTAPTDNVLQNSAQGFTQGLYPPVGGAASAQTLRNGSITQAPLDGYQLIPVGMVSGGGGSEDTSWLQDSTDCGNAETSSNDYYYTPEYMALLNQTMEFYKGLSPVINSTFGASQQSYKNAYSSMTLLSFTLHAIAPSRASMDGDHVSLTAGETHSIRLPECSQYPQRHHSLSRPPQRFHPLHSAVPSRNARVRPRLQHHLSCPRHRRRPARRPGRRLPQLYLRRASPFLIILP